MQSYFLDKHDIISITGERFYKRGYEYVKKGRVQGLSFTPSINQWKAVVRGAENYHVRIFFYEDDDLEGVCECPAYATHYTCKHIAAVLISVSQNRLNASGYQVIESEKPSAASSYQTEFTKRLVQAFSSNSRNLHSQPAEALNIAYKVSQKFQQMNGSTVLEVELKAGASRLYIVRMAEEFTRSMLNGTNYQLTPSFAVDPRKYFIKKEDEEILSLLLEASENGAVYDQGLQTLQSEKRTIKMSPAFADQLLPLLADAGAELELLHREPMTSFYVSEQPARLDFYLSADQQEMMQLSIKELAEYEYIKHYHYLVKDETLYPVPRQQRNIIKDLYELLPYRYEVPQTVPQDQIESFVTHVVDKLEQVGHVHVTEDVKQKVELAPLEAKVYLDETDDVLQAEVAFHYGTHVIRPGDKQQAVIKRQTAAEEAVLDILQASGFRFVKGRFHLLNLEKMYAFLNERLPELQQLATVYTSTAIEALTSNEQIDFSSSVRLQREQGMLDISFDVGGLSEEAVANVLQAMIEKKRYYRIPDGALVDLQQESMHSFYELVDRLHIGKQQVQDQHLYLPVAQSLEVSDTLSQAQTEAAFEMLITRLKNPAEIQADLPASLQANLRDYQLTGFKWLKTLAYYGLGGILADDMGLGKTLQTIAYLLSEKEQTTEQKLSLIVVPSSLLYNWEKEFEKFAPTMKTIVLSGSIKERKELFAKRSEADVLITSYPLLRKDHTMYKELQFDSMILDEAQAIKNHATQTARAVRMVHAAKRFALSGTPIENSLEELWSLFLTVSPGLFSSRKDFIQLEPKKIAQLTRPFILRRIKGDVLHELPEKIETTNYSELTTNQKEVYLAYVERIKTQMNKTIAEKGFERSKLEILAGLTRLRQICCHPSLFLENYEGQSGKLEQLLEIVRELKQNGKRFLIFSQFSTMLRLIQEHLSETDAESFYLDGSTPSQERMQMAEAFNAGEKDCFLISLKAGGTGLNLTGADTVILFDLWWNPAVEEQAAGRAHRIGQKSVVQVIRLLTKGTIEERIYELQQHKRELVDQIIQPGETMLTKLSEEEIRSLLQVNIM